MPNCVRQPLCRLLHSDTASGTGMTSPQNTPWRSSPQGAERPQSAAVGKANRA